MTWAMASLGADVSLSVREDCLIELNGEIIAGDAEQVRNLIAEDWDGSRLYNINADRLPLCLDSPGGSFQEASAIAQEIHDRAINTMIRPGAECFSACALIFMAGRTRSGETDGPDRTLHVDGRLGFHAPYLSLDPNATFKGTTVNAYVPEHNLLIADFIRFSSFRSVFQVQPSVSLGLLAEMLAAPPDEMFLIDTVEKAARWNIGLFGIAEDRELSTRDFAQACKNELTWLYDSASEQMDDDEYASLQIESGWSETYFGPGPFVEVMRSEFATQTCRVDDPRSFAGWLGLCISDGYTVLSLGECTDPNNNSPVWVPWWHAMSPDMPLGELK